MMLDDVLRLLNSSELLNRLQVVELIVYGENAFRVKVRAEVTGETAFQVWLNHNNHHTRYAYQLFLQGQTILRWDNAPHHPAQSENFPHHMHTRAGHVVTSPLTGDPVIDLAKVLKAIEDYVHADRLLHS